MHGTSGPPMDAPSSMDTPSPTNSTSTTPTAYEELKSFLGPHSNVAILRHCLGIARIPDAPALLDHAVVNTIDCESSERVRGRLTEIGLATFCANDMLSQPATALEPFGENLFKNVYYYHWRLIPNAHLINRKFCPGDPTRNHFGSTRFVTVDEAKKAMTDSFNWWIDEKKPELGFCPVIFVGHAVGNDIGMLNNSLGFNTNIFGTVVKTIDTQHLARAVGIPSRGEWIGLGDLCNRHGFVFRDSHTAGNDAAYTLFCAVFMAMQQELLQNGPATKTSQEVVDAVAKWSRDHADTSYGPTLYCERCGRRNAHLRAQCRAKVRCQKCKDAGRDRASFSHMTQSCTWN